MVYKQMIILTIIGVMVLKCTYSQTFPENPCPDLFQYLKVGDVIYGRMEFPNDNSGYYQLSVNMSVAVNLTHNKNIDIELRTSANDLALGRSVVYHVYFPIQTVVPKPTLIEFNNRVYCAGPSEELRPRGGVTNMWTTIYYGFSQPPVNRQIIPNTPPEIEVITTYPELPKLPPSSSVPVTWATLQNSTAETPNPATFKTPTFVDRGPIDNECGLTSVTQQLVVGGRKIHNGEYPWMVALMYLQDTYKYRCTGSLVSTRHVITAAHCVWINNGPIVQLEAMLLVFGKNNISNLVHGALIRDVQDIKPHPNFNDTRRGHCDIAILTTNKPVEFSPSIRPVCVWKGDASIDHIVGKEGIVVGWWLDETGSITDAKKVNLPVVGAGKCLRSDTRFTYITSESTFCAGNRDGSGPCLGGSGSGFVMNLGGRWFLRGIFAASLSDHNTCDLHNYFVFADVAKAIKWINDMIT